MKPLLVLLTKNACTTRLFPFQIRLYIAVFKRKHFDGNEMFEEEEEEVLNKCMNFFEILYAHRLGFLICEDFLSKKQWFIKVTPYMKLDVLFSSWLMILQQFRCRLCCFLLLSCQSTGRHRGRADMSACIAHLTCATGCILWDCCISWVAPVD